jgi:hypothetical protein
MAEDKVVVVHLRMPGKNDNRSDPFWEFGSFGITHCHADNLMNPKRVTELLGVRFAFAQGGNLGTRLVFLTPPIHQAIPYKDRSEMLWKPHLMPFRYEPAPLLIDNAGKSDFRLLKRSLKGVLRNTWVGRFSSKFRSRRHPLGQAEALEVITIYQSCRKSGGQECIAQNYVDALPVRRAPVSQAEREAAYDGYGDKAGKTLTKKEFSCRPKRNIC